MNNAQYLEAAGRTEKQFPEGLKISVKVYQELMETFRVFIESSQKIDQLKKQIIYKGLGSEPGDMVWNLDAQQAKYLHYIMGMAGEVGEIAEQLGPELVIKNITHFIEELGDYRWYEAGFYRSLEVTQEEVQAANIRKLIARYPDTYSDLRALERDKTAELHALENV